MNPTAATVPPPSPKDSWDVLVVSGHIPIAELSAVVFDRPLPVPLAITYPASFVVSGNAQTGSFQKIAGPVDRHGNPVRWDLYDFAVAVDKDTYDWMLLEKISGRPMPAFGCLAPDTQTFIGDLADPASGLGWFEGDSTRAATRISMLLAASVDTRHQRGPVTLEGAEN